MKIAYIGQKPLYLLGKHFPLHKSFHNQEDKDAHSKEICHQLLDYHPDIIQLEAVEDYSFSWEILFLFLGDLGKPVLWHLKKESFLQNVSFLEKKNLFQHLKQLYILSNSRYLLRAVNRTFLAEYPCLYLPDAHSFHETKIHDEKKNFQILFYSDDWNENSDDLQTLLPYIPSGIFLRVCGKNASIFTYSPRCHPSEILDEQDFSQSSLYIDIVKNEDFPMISLRALSYNLPVIAFAYKGREEVATDILEIKDYERLQNCILAYWENPHKKGVFPLEKAREYSLEVLKIRYDMLYQIIHELG